MANPSVTYTFTNGTVADASQVNQNFTDLINGLTDGSKSLNVDAITAAGTASLNGAVNLGNATGDIITVNGVFAGTGGDASGAQKGVVRGASTFSVYASGNQTGLTSGSFYKISLNTEEFDTDNYFDSTTNYRYTPSAGYYKISGACKTNNAANITTAELHIYKNNSSFKLLDVFQNSGTTTGAIQLSGSVDLYANGTDYFDLVITQTGGGTFNILGSQSGTYMSGSRTY